MHSSRRFGVEREGMDTHDAPAWFSFWVFSNEILYENAIIHPSLCLDIISGLRPSGISSNVCFYC